MQFVSDTKNPYAMLFTEEQQKTSTQFVATSSIKITVAHKNCTENQKGNTVRQFKMQNDE